MDLFTWNDMNEPSVFNGPEVRTPSIVLYCTVLYCTVLYCTVLYCTVLYCTVLYCTDNVLYLTLLMLHLNGSYYYYTFILRHILLHVCHMSCIMSL